MSTKHAPRWPFPALGAVTLAVFVGLIYLIFFVAPPAQATAGGIAQKIFYFHVPSAYAMYLSGAACFFASAAYLAGPSDGKNALARAGAECACLFGSMMLVSGPLWAKKAWGVYWTWDPRLTTTLLSVLVYVAVVVLRTFTGDGEAERKFAAGLGVLGTVNLPIIHYSVMKWGGNHPTVIGKGGGGLGHPAMKLTLLVGFVAMTLLAVLLVWLRTRLALLGSRLAQAEEEVLSLEPGEES
ncbi:MAG TPA: cytochrome c biogenesis protein [Polyangiaceae bacterium]|nr:cytochrome c biogenesis protein [Polyangiaceae bacterium]